LKHGFPQISVLGPLLFIIHRSDLSLRINAVPKQTLFVDDTNVLIVSRNFKDFCSVSNLFLSLVKTNVMKLIQKNSAHATLHKQKYIEERLNTEFSGLKFIIT
jgi:hypothetical protein